MKKDDDDGTRKTEGAELSGSSSVAFFCMCQQHEPHDLLPHLVLGSRRPRVFSHLLLLLYRPPSHPQTSGLSRRVWTSRHSLTMGA